MVLNNLEDKECKVVIQRTDEQDKLNFDILDKVEINLGNDSSEDIQNLFNEIFEYIVETKTLLKFTLEDSGSDLITEVVVDILNQLNREIKSSEEMFIKIIKINEEIKTERKINVN